ncbi:TPA: hypothetical protein ACT9MM_000252 [Legionella pneumophila]
MKKIVSKIVDSQANWFARYCTSFYFSGRNAKPEKDLQFNT